MRLSRPAKIVLAILSALGTISINAVTLTGCISTIIPTVYLLDIRTGTATNSSATFQARVGFFGICFGDPTITICFPTYGAATDVVIAKLQNSTLSSPAVEMDQTTDIVNLALSVQHDFFFGPLLATAAGIFFIDCVFFGLLHVKKLWSKNKFTAKRLRRHEIYKRIACYAMWSSNALAIASAIIFTLTGNSMQRISQVEVSQEKLAISISASITMKGLQWAAVLTSMLFSMIFVLKSFWQIGRDVENGSKDSDNNSSTQGKPTPAPAAKPATSKQPPPFTEKKK